MIIPYGIDVPRGIRFEWCRQVADVRPKEGNGWDIIGTFVSLRGVAEGGSLLCTKARVVGEYGTVYAAWKVIEGVIGNVECLASSKGMIAPVVNISYMCEEFPALRDAASIGMMQVEYALLRELRQRAVIRQRGEMRQEVESTLAEMSRMNEVVQREQTTRENMERHYGEVRTQRMIDNDMMTRYPMWGFDPVTGVARRVPLERVVIEKKPVEIVSERSIRDYEPGKRKMRE